MEPYANTFVTKHIKLCSIDVAEVLQKGAMLNDSLELTKSLLKELEAQSSQYKFLEAVGVVVIQSARTPSAHRRCARKNRHHTELTHRRVLKNTRRCKTTTIGLFFIFSFCNFKLEFLHRRLDATRSKLQG